MSKENIAIYSRQEIDYWCGIATLEMVLKNGGLYISQSEIAKYSFNNEPLVTEEGTNYKIMYAFLKEYFSKVEVLEKSTFNDLYSLREDGNEVITTITAQEHDEEEAPYEGSHYVRIGEVFGGHEDGCIEIFDPTNGSRLDGNSKIYTLSEADFMVLWEHWALVVDIGSKI